MTAIVVERLEKITVDGIIPEQLLAVQTLETRAGG
jgi:hypothetical protein